LRGALLLEGKLTIPHGRAVRQTITIGRDCRPIVGAVEELGLDQVDL